MRTRRTTLLALVVCLVLAGCGTRLDRDTIVRAAGSAGGATGEAGAFGDDLGGVGGKDAKRGAGKGPGALGPGGVDGTGSGPGGSRGSNGAGGTARGGVGGDGSPLVIGTVGSYSGPGGTALAQGARALQVWAADVNAKGGLNGHPVKLIVMDDGGDAAKARSMIKELVEERRAVAVVGAFSVVETLNSWKDYVEEKQVPVVGGSCGPEWTQRPMLFRQCAISADQIYGSALVGARYGRSKKFGGMFCSETQSCTYVEEQLFGAGGAKRAGLDPRYRARMSVFQADFTAECIQARNAGVELLMVVADPGTVERVASSCGRQNFRPQFLEIATTVRASTVSRPGLGDLLVALSTFPFAGMSSPAAGEFTAAWKRYGGGAPPGPAATQGWASGKLFEKAVAAAGSSVTRASLISALRKMRGERLGGLTVPLTFGPKGPANGQCTYYMKGSGGRWTAPGGGKLLCW